MATAMALTTETCNNTPNANVQDIADSIVGNENSLFNYSDICSDAFAKYIYSELE